MTSNGGRLGLALLAGIVLLVAWGALAFGAVYPWAFTPLAIGAAIVGATALVALPAGRPPIHDLAVALAVVAAAIALQLAPLPQGLLDRVSPHLDAFTGQAAPMASASAAHPLSIDPGRTLVGLGLFAAFALLLLGSARLTSALGARATAFVPIVFGMVLAVVGIGQYALTAHQVHPLIYGFWKPQFESRPFGPFVNPNHFAGWMLMAMPLALGGFLDAFQSAVSFVAGRRTDRRSILGSPDFGASMLFAGAYAVMGLSLLMTRSRSGLAAFAVGAGLAAVLVVRRQRSRGVGLAVVGGMAVLMLGAAAWSGFDNPLTKNAEGDRGRSSAGARLDAWRDTLRIAGDFRFAGTGLDTYAPAMELYQTERSTHFQEAHNDYLQLAAEGGLLIGLPALAVLGIFVRDVRRRFREAPKQGSTYWIRIGAVIALVSIAMQSAVEFSLQMPGNAALFAVVAGLAIHRSPNLRAK